MSIELITAVTAVIVSILGAILNFYKLKDTQKTWEHEQKISMEKALLIKRLDKRFNSYSKIFSLLGKVRDIEYPKEHYLDLESNKSQLIKIADALLEELYGEAGLFMEYETRSLILKTYQASYKYANHEIELSELVDSYYNARRLIRKDLEFDDNSGAKTAQDILKDRKEELEDNKIKEEKSFWAIKGELARSSRPGYPSKSVSYETVQNTIESWKKQKINSIICLLSDEEIQTYYKSLNSDLISYYQKQGFDVFHVSIEDYQNPPVNKEDIKIIYEQYQSLQKPILVHCGAGKDRTGQTVNYILNS